MAGTVWNNAEFCGRFEWGCKTLEDRFNYERLNASERFDNINKT